MIGRALTKIQLEKIEYACLHDSANFVVSTVNAKEDTNPTLNTIQAPHPYIYCRVNYPLVAWAACLSQAEISNAGIFSKRTNMFL